MDLSFPSSSLDAARKQLQRWEIDTSLPLEQNIPKLEERLRPIVANQYGIEEAILERKRMRLLDERGFDRYFNCAELGVNLLLLFHAMGKENAQLLRYVAISESYHFGVFVDDWLFDPLYGVADKVRLVSKGLYVPKRGEREARLYKEECALLTVDDAMRHLNFINSPLGFFDYYKGCQKIRWNEESLQATAWSVYAEDDWFMIRMTGADGLLDLYTFQKSYWYENGELVSREKHVSHCGLDWLTPSEPFYIEVNDKETSYEFCTPEEKSKAVMAFSEVAWAMGSEKWQQFLEDNQRGLLDPIIDVAAAAEREFMSVGKREADYEYYCKKLLPYIWNLEDHDLRQFLISYYHAENLRARRVIAEPHARGKFYKSNEENMKTYAAVRKKMFKPSTDALLASDVHKILLEEYQEAYRLKQASDALVNT